MKTLLNSSYFLITLVILTNVAGQIMFKVVANGVKNETRILAVISKLMYDPVAWISILLYSSMVITWIWVLRIMPLSIAYSSIALVFVLVPIFSNLLFNEPLSIKFLIGTAFIMLGIIIIHN